jgi:nucleoside-diphosphate-sugar epimerase
LTETAPLRPTRFLDGPDWENLDIEERYLAAGGTILRLGAVYGEHDYQYRMDFVLRRMRARRRRMPIGSGTFLFSRVYVRDVATAVLAALETGNAAGEIFNIAESATASFRLFAEQIVQAAGGGMDLVTVADRALPPDLSITGAGTQHQLMDASKARRQLEWRTGDTADALRRTVRWHLENPPAHYDTDFALDDAALDHAG